ncbi:LysE family translocator [Allokutzneria multivorans]|uniref:LysE family translocator n=1 Tax=Allokutzneria multivorans TaxID=1142134 RepID=A0ABP7SI54_9PSEU
MPPLAAIIGFGFAILPVVLTPGASFTLVAAHGAAPVVVRRVVLGTALGILSHAALAALGLSVIVMESAQLYRLVQVAGALCLIGLGVASLLRGRRVTTAARSEEPVRVHTAFLMNLLNPKAAAVYLTLAPQFLASNAFTAANVLVLALVHAVLMACWLTTCATVLRSLRAFALHMARIGGVVLIAFGLTTLLRVR